MKLSKADIAYNIGSISDDLNTYVDEFTYGIRSFNTLKGDVEYNIQVLQQTLLDIEEYTEDHDELMIKKIKWYIDHKEYE